MTIDLKSGTAQPARPADYSTRCTAVEPQGDCPLWLAFLNRITAQDIDLQAYLQRVAGYALTGVTTEHALFFLYGTGSNGKSVFINTIAGVMGTYAMTAPIEMFMASSVDRHPTELAMLRGARLVTAIETESGRHWSEARLKALTGGDPVTARFMRQDFFEFKPQFKLMIAGNHKPALRSVDEAIRRRLHMIPFTVTIPPEDRDRDLEEKLKAEWPGILQWMIEGCLDWQEQGLAPPVAVLDATAEYLGDEDSFATWLEESCERQSQAHELSKDLYASWKRWADAAGEIAGTAKAFSQAMKTRGFEAKRQGGTGKAGFSGIRLVRTNYTDDPRDAGM